MKKGKLIVIEACADGAGKSTQYKLLIDRLSKEEDIVTHHFPSYGTYQARCAEEYLKGNYGKITDLSPYFVNSLYAADRSITWITGLKNEYEKGKILIVDRYTTSSLIYQSAVFNTKEEIDNFSDYVADYEYNKLGVAKPDLVIFLHMPFELNIKLKKNRKNNDGIKNDIYEIDLEFMKRVYDTSVQIAKKFNWDFIECSHDGVMYSIEEIHEKVYELVSNKLLSK